MSLADKANSIRELVSLVTSVLPKIVELIIEVCTLIKEVRTNA